MSYRARLVIQSMLLAFIVGIIIMFWICEFNFLSMDGSETFSIITVDKEVSLYD